MLNNDKSQDSMDILHSPQQYLFNLQTTNTGQARRMWRQKIKERWEYKCAYCGSDSELTIDHIVPRCKGGIQILRRMWFAVVRVAIKIKVTLRGMNGISLRSFLVWIIIKKLITG